MSKTGLYVWLLLIVCAAGLWPRPAVAQSGGGDLWQTFGAPGELPSQIVSSALLAKDGTLWFGTEAGAVHYDGAWKVLDSHLGLPAGRIRAIVQAPDGALWFGTEHGGLARCATGEACSVLTVKDGLPADDVRALAIDADDEVWAGTAAGLAHLAASPGAPIRVEAALTGIPIWSLSVSLGGDLWIGTQQQGLWRRKAGLSERLQTGDLLTGDIYAIAADREGGLWLGTENGLFASRPGSGWSAVSLGDSLPGSAGLEPRVFALGLDAEAGLWIGTESGGLYRSGRRGADALPLTSAEGLANDFVRTLVLDDEGGVWFGTNAGVSRYGGATWRLIREANLAGEQINALLTDSLGRTWVGTEQDGLKMWDGAGWHLFSVEAGMDNDGRVLALHEDRRGRLWIGAGTGAGYLECAERACLAARWKFIDVEAGLPGIPVWSLAEDVDGRIWLGTNEGAAWWEENTGLHVVPDLAGARINAILRARDGALWIGTQDKGLWRLADGQWRIMPAGEDPPRFTSIALHGIAEAPDGTLWVGTYDANLWRFYQGEWFPEPDVPAGPAVLGVSYLRDSLWVGAYNGLGRYDGRTWQLYSGPIFPGSQVRAIAAGTAGTYWIGTSGGLVQYCPDGKRPWVRIEAVNSQAPRDGRVILQNGALQEVRLEGGDLSTHKDALSFLTTLEGVDKSPRMGSDPLIVYGGVDLSPGSYRLQVIARDQAYNYSDPVEVILQVPAGEPHIALPWFGRQPMNVVLGIVFLGVLAFGGLVTAVGTAWQAKVQAHRQAAALAARRRDAIERHFNPYISGEPVRVSDMFFGRRDLLHKIIGALHQNSIMISGERRIGKTSLLLQIADALRPLQDPEWVFVPVYIDLEGTTQERFFALLMEEILAAQRDCLPVLPGMRLTEKQATGYDDRDFAADLRAVLEALKLHCTPRAPRLILLLDEMDVINTYDTVIQQQLRRIYMTRLAQNLGAVVAGVAISKDWVRVESPWYNMFNEIVLSPLSDEDARRLLTEPVTGIYEWQAEALEFVLARAEGRPYRLQQLGLEAVNRMLMAGRTQILVADVKAAAEVIAGPPAAQAPVERVEPGPTQSN